jgi:hypothetical protein
LDLVALSLRWQAKCSSIAGEGRQRLNSSRFQETVDDPYFKFENLTDETTVDITAYVLQMNGGKPGSQQLTRSTGTIVGSIAR